MLLFIHPTLSDKECDMKPVKPHRTRNTTFSALALSALSFASIAPLYAASDIMITRPHSASMSSNVYLGANLGNAKYDKASDSSASFGIFGGIHINEILAIDLGWADLGEVTSTASKTEVSVLQVGLLGKFPVKTGLSMFGKVGLARWTYDFSSTALSGSDDDINVYFGLGVDYHISGHSAVRFGADFYNVKPTISNVTLPKENISLFSIGYIFNL